MPFYLLYCLLKIRRVDAPLLGKGQSGEVLEGEVDLDGAGWWSDAAQLVPETLVLRFEGGDLLPRRLEFRLEVCLRGSKDSWWG